MNTVTRRIRELQLAFMLLTRLPAGKGADDEIPLPSAAWAYPVAGLAVGGIGAAVLAVSTMILALPQSIGAILAVAAMAVATGGLHEDGLADTADGFGGGSTKDRKLEIMRDSRIGSYGVMALIIVTALRVAALASLPLSYGCLGLIVIAAAARGVLPVVMRLQVSARPAGLGASAASTQWRPVWASAAVGILSLALLLPLAHGFVAGIVIVLVTLGLCLLSARQIHGFTGDTLGATVQLAEAAALTSLLVL